MKRGETCHGSYSSFCRPGRIRGWVTVRMSPFEPISSLKCVTEKGAETAPLSCHYDCTEESSLLKPEPIPGVLAG